MSRARRTRKSADSDRQSAHAGAARCPSAPPSLEELAACCEGRIPPHDEIAARAREIWEARGRPTDQDLEIWITAEGDLLRRRV